MPNTTPATPAQGFPVPVVGSDPDVTDDMFQLAKAIEKRVMGVYATAAARDSATTTAGVEEGMFAYTKDNNLTWQYTGSGWVEWPPRQQKIGAGTTLPTAGDPAYINGDVFFKV